MRIDKSSTVAAPIRWMQSSKKSPRKTSRSHRAGSLKNTRNDDNDAWGAGKKSLNEKKGLKGKSRSSGKKSTSQDNRRNARNTSRARSRSRSRSRKVARSRSRKATRSRSRKASRSRSRKASRSRSRARRVIHDQNDESREPAEVQRTKRDSERKPTETPWALLSRRSLSKTRNERSRSFGKATSETRIVKRPSMSNFGFFKKANAGVTMPGETEESDDWRGSIIADSKLYGDSPSPAAAIFENGRGTQLDNNNLSEHERLSSSSRSEDGGIELIAMVNESGKPFTRIIVEKDAGFQNWHDKLGNKNHVTVLRDFEETKGTKLSFFKNDQVDKPIASRTKKFLKALPWRQSSKTSRSQKSDKIRFENESCFVHKEPSLPANLKTSLAPPESNKDTKIPDSMKTNESEKREEQTLDEPPKDTATGFELIAMWMKDGKDSTKSNDSKSKKSSRENKATEIAQESRSSDTMGLGRHHLKSLKPGNQVAHPRISADRYNGSTASHANLANSIQENDVNQSAQADDHQTTNLIESVRRDSFSASEQRDKVVSESSVPESASTIQKERSVETESKSINPLDAFNETR